MREPRIYQPLQALNEGISFQLDAFAFQHTVRVLRLKAGHSIRVFNGMGSEARARLTNVTRQQATATLTEITHTTPPPALSIHLGQAISKGDRMDWAVQKAVELGVTAITPLFSQRSDVKLKGERLEKKQQHWQKIVIAACEQCEQNWLPTLHPPEGLTDWLCEPRQGQRWILDGNGTRPQPSDPAPAQLTLAVGPEGGFSPDEIRLAHSHNFHSIRLGPRVLRTETAPVAALTLAQYWWGNW